MMQIRVISALASGMLMAGASPALPQTSSVPVVAGVVSAASYSSPVEPGSLVSIFGSNLAAVTQSAPSSVTPLPTSLGGTTVTFNSVAAPLFFVSPGQINAQVPSSVKANASTLSSATVVVSTPGGSSAPSQVSVFAVGPGVFTSDASGCGAAAALNIAPDGVVSMNSPANSAAPGDYVAIFGTGLGVPGDLPADGTPAATADPFTPPSGLYLDRSSLGAPAYSGLAPTLVGVGQINFQIPEDARQGCAVPLVVDSSGILLSPVVTISVHPGRGQCIDLPVQSYGQVWLERTIASGTSNDGESDEFNAVFPSGPGLQLPPLPVITPGTGNAFSTPAPGGKVCPVAGYSELSAGVITIQTPAQTGASAQPVVQAAGGVAYHQALPAGFVAPGQYSIASQTGAPIVFQETLSVGPGIDIQTSITPGTQLSNTLTWTGGDASEVVRVTLIDDASQIASPKDVSYVSASAGSLGLGTCQESPYPGPGGGVTKICGFGLPNSNNAQLIIDVLPANGAADSASAQGISQLVRFSWAYHYVFGGLSITE